MDWLDYRQALGLSFNDNQKKSLFIKRIEVFMQSGENCPFEEQDEIGLAYMIGESYLLAEQDPRDFDFGNDPLGLQRAWLYLSKRTKSFADFLSCLVALINTYGGKKTDKRTILLGIKKALEDCRISFETIEDDDGIFIFPKGTKELDDALVSEPLEWLADYPESRKALENSSLEEAEAFHQRTNQRILPNLDENIKNGNSLVNMAYARFDRSVYQNVSLMNKLKMFDWNAEFGNRKFDAIIGNPPYIRVQNMVHYSREEYDFYKSNHSPYVTAQTDTLDKYYLFIEKGLTLLNDGGMLGYIVPHKFMNIKSGAKLRELLSSNSSVKKILYFGTHQVFENRSTYTCILVLSKQGHEEFQIGFVQDWNRFLFNHDTECLTYPAAYISGQPWSFLPQNIVAHLEEISQSCVPLSSLVDIFVGVQTSADQIYIIHADREDDNFIYSHDRQGREFQIEKGILRKSIYDTQLVCYEKIKANSYIIFPYKSVNGRPVLYSLDEMTTDFPHALAYLNSFKNKLDERNMPGRTTENWFAFGRSQSLKRFLAGEHLVWPVLSTSSNYVYDNH